MRTLVVSDLHLGAAPRNDVLRHEAMRRPLLQTLSSCERLVLLGDVLELRHGPAYRALQVARPVLAELAAALRPPREVVIVAGNHDHGLLAPWLERRASAPLARSLELETAVDWREGELLDALAAALEPARLRAVYPGVWLRDDVYATHGHYSDRHSTVPLFERVGAGLVARVVSEPPGGPMAAEDYEGSLAPMYAFIDAVVRRRPPKLDPGGETFQVRAWRRLSGPDGRFALRRAALRGGFSATVAGLNRAGLGPLRADVSGTALRDGGLFGMREVLRRLEIPANHVIFGHTHRAGPLPGDALDGWQTDSGTALWNSGSWVLERSYLGSEPGPSPYRPGFCALVSATGPPEIVNLLDEAAAQLGDAGRAADRVAANPL
ncbi:MAG: metallophosphoesterase family protein [Solirubrobacterales bacterium]|nr:metallophosphoesterase family protein [Solirubrobacterales bacterium]